MYDIIANLVDAPANYANSTIMQICGVVIVLVIVWFLDCLVRLFKI